MALDLCIQIAKYSHATCDPSTRSLPWTHMVARDIFLIIRGSDTQNGALNMTIVHATSTLETIDIAEYIDAAIRLRATTPHAAGATLAAEDLPVFGIVKENLLALRFRLRNGQVRRLQLRMQTPADCRKVMSTFEKRGMDFQEQRPRTAQPRTHPDHPIAPRSDSRPITAQMASPFPLRDQRPTGQEPTAQAVFHVPAVEAGSLSHRPVSSTGTAREAAYLHVPSTASDHVARTNPVTTGNLSSLEPPPRPTTSGLSRPDTAPVEGSYPERRANEAYRTPYNAGYSTHQPTLGRANVKQASSGATDSRHSATFRSSESSDARPVTATTFTTTSPGPPSAFMPYCSPMQHRPESSNTSRPGSALSLPPLQRPTIVREPAISPTNERYASPIRNNDSTQTRDAVLRPQQSSDAIMPLPVAALEMHRSPTIEKYVAAPQNADAPGMRAGRAVPMDNLAHERRPLQERPNNISVPRISSVYDAPHEIVSPPRTKRLLQPAAYSGNNSQDMVRKESCDHVIGRTGYAFHPSGADRPEEESLQRYAEQSRDDRLAALDQFMVENLENPTFTTLCEDVENCWRRIALGL